MTIDERLERLTERHEALTQSVEMLVAEGRELDKRLAAMGEKTDQRFVTVSEDISRLLTIVTIQNERIKRLEDN